MKVAEDYIKTLTDPSNWFQYYRHQKLIGDILLEKAISKDEIVNYSANAKGSDFATILINAHYHWGIAIENGLKGIVAKYHPEEIEYEVRGKNVIIKNIGGKAGKTHKLLQLAEHVGIFSNDYNIFIHDSDYISLKQVLLHLSDVIKWAARYPISNNTATIFVLSKDVPPVLVYGFHILDVMQPLFDLFEKEMN